MDVAELASLWHKTPKKLLAAAGAAAAGVAIDRRISLVNDIRDIVKLSGLLRLGKRTMAEKTLVPDVFQQAVAQFPQQICMSFEGRHLTFAQVDALSNRVAQWALRQGFKPGDKVAFLMENRPEYVAFWLGLTKVCVVAALINTYLLADGLVHCISIADAKSIVVGVELLDKFATIVDRVGELPVHVFGDGVTLWRETPQFPFARSLDEQLKAVRDTAIAREYRKDITTLDTALLIYTSGTTGLPKAARVNHYNVLIRSLGLQLAMEVTANDRLYCPLPLYHTSGGNLAVGICFYSGARLCISRKFSASRFWREVKENDCTIVQYIGEMARYVVNAPPQPTDKDNNVRAAFGNGLRPDVWNEFQDRFGISLVAEFYGATEGVLGFLNVCAKQHDRGHLGRRGRLMQALTGARVVKYNVDTDSYVRDPKTGFLKECAYGEVGELLCKLTQDDPSKKFSGYYKNDGESNKKVLTDVFTKGDVYFRTGDLFKIDSNHCWHFVDRVGDTFRWKGENVATNEVAEAIARFPGLSDICVYGVEVPGSEGRACMAAMVFDENNFDLKAFANHVKARLPSYAMPLFLRQLGEMAVTGTMKYEKAKLRKQGMDPSQITDKLWIFAKDKHTYERLTNDNFHATVVGSRL